MVEAGIFTLSGKNREGEYSRQLTLAKDYWIGKYLITQVQYQKVMGSNPSEFVGDNNPAEISTRRDAQEFCKKLGNGCRLPIEAEWQFAAIGGNLSRGYVYSGSDNIDDVAWHRRLLQRCRSMSSL